MGDIDLGDIFGSFFGGGFGGFGGSQRQANPNAPKRGASLRANHHLLSRGHDRRGKGD